MRYLTTTIYLFIVFFASVVPAHAGETWQPETLSSLRGVFVTADVSGSVRAAYFNSGIREKDVEAFVSRALQQSGIRVFSRSEYLADPAKPKLRVSISTVDQPDANMMATSVAVSLRQDVYLANKQKARGTTYFAGEVYGVLFKNNLLGLENSVMELVNDFIHDWKRSH